VPAAIPWDAEIYPVLFAVAGALVAVALPRRAVGWLMLFVGACFALNAMALQWLATGHAPAAAWLAWWAERASAVVVPATLALVLLLPDGRLPSARWRPVLGAVLGVQLAVVAVGSLVAGPVAVSDPPPAGTAGLDNPLGVLPQDWFGTIELLIGPVLILPFLLGVAAVVERFRRPAGDERPRVVLVLLGLLTFILAVTLPDLLWPASSTWFHIAGVVVLTATIVAAVVRGQFAPVRVDEPAAVTGPVRARPPDSVVAALSPREREVMEHVARGQTNSEIAEELVISPITVRNHVSSILTKLDVSNRTQAVARYLGDEPQQDNPSAGTTPSMR
jgi:DNA-binding CsgD family transcriptional regulator